MKKSKKNKSHFLAAIIISLLLVSSHVYANSDEQEPAEEKQKTEQVEPAETDTAFVSCPIEGTSSYRRFLNKILCVMDSPTLLASLKDWISD